MANPGYAVDMGANIDFLSAAIDLAAATDNQEIVAAPAATQEIWVYGAAFTTEADSTIQFLSDGDTALTGTMPFLEHQGMVMNPSGNPRMPWFKVPVGEALDAKTVGAGGTYDGVLVYAIVTPADWE